MNYVKANAQGRIIGGGSCPDALFDIQKRDGVTLIPGDGHPDTHFVRDGQILPKADMAVACETGDRILRLSSLPVPCTVFIGLTPYAVDDGTLEVEFAYPGEHEVTVDAVPFLAWKQKVTV